MLAATCTTYYYLSTVCECPVHQGSCRDFLSASSNPETENNHKNEIKTSSKRLISGRPRFLLSVHTEKQSTGCSSTPAHQGCGYALSLLLISILVGGGVAKSKVSSMCTCKHYAWCKPRLVHCGQGPTYHRCNLKASGSCCRLG